MKTDTPEVPTTAVAAAASSSALYRAVWRWHFFAGIAVAPFALFLALTGSIYLWKPQFEAWRYRELFTVPIASATEVSADAQLAAARAAHPTWAAQQFTPALRPGRTAEVLMTDTRGQGASVYVDPYRGTVVGALADADRPMKIIHDLHGTLFAGRCGELVVELVASWAFVLLVTGFYLWWPRPFTIGGFLLPRFGAGRRALLRDLHAVPAVWLSALTLVLLATGIPWTTVGGAWIKRLARLVGEWQPAETSASAHRSAILGGWSPFLKDAALAERLTHVASQRPAADEHAGHHHGGGAGSPTPEATELSAAAAATSISLDRVMAIARERRVPDAYAIVLPQSATGVYSIISDRNRAFSRAFVHIDRYSGKVLADVRYGDFGAIAKFFSFGIIWHEGQLFGLFNQIVGTLTGLGVALLACTGLALWWSRRPRGELGAPARAARETLPRGVMIVVVGLACFLPLMAATLVVLAAFDWLFRRRLLRLSSRV